MGWGPIREPPQDHLAHRLRLPEHLMVPEPQDPEAACTQERIALAVPRRIGVLSPIHFHHESRRQTGEIDDVDADRMLPAKAVAIELAHAQVTPEQSLGVCHGGAQRSRAVALLALAHRRVRIGQGRG